MLSFCCEAVVARQRGGGGSGGEGALPPLSRPQERFLIACMSLVKAVVESGPYRGRTAGGGAAKQENEQVGANPKL